MGGEAVSGERVEGEISYADGRWRWWCGIVDGSVPWLRMDGSPDSASGYARTQAKAVRRMTREAAKLQDRIDARRAAPATQLFVYDPDEGGRWAWIIRGEGT